MLEPAEGDRGSDHPVCVDPHAAGPDAGGHAVGTVNVLGPDRAGQAVGRVVGEFDGLVLVGEGEGGEHRAEDLLLEDGGLGRDAGEHGRLYEQAAEPAVGGTTVD